MAGFSPETTNLLFLIGAIFLAIMAVLWFCLPFAVFGIKALLRQILAEQRQTNERLEQLAPRSGYDAPPKPALAQDTPRRSFWGRLPSREK
jgi:hypothetical protein